MCIAFFVSSSDKRAGRYQHHENCRFNNNFRGVFREQYDSELQLKNLLLSVVPVYEGQLDCSRETNLDVY